MKSNHAAKYARTYALGAVLLATFVGGDYAAANNAKAAEAAYYNKEPAEFNKRPRPAWPGAIGYIGSTGIKATMEKWTLNVIVDGVVPGTPSEGKFEKGEILLGVNGTALKGKNLYVVLGKAITAAEARDGKLVFDVQSGEAKKQVTVTIPVMGAYSKTWPVDCAKSDRIAARAAEFYAAKLEKGWGGRPGHVARLFLLSTGDDKYLPLVKKGYQKSIDNPKGIGKCTWMNGYMGVVVAEYYLRTGDGEVLPLLQAVCDEARDGQTFGATWGHYSPPIQSWYDQMNAAGIQLLTTMILAKQCGCDVDEKTLLGSLRFFYQYAGKGNLSYGLNRPEAFFGSNGKNGMVAAAMQAACYSQGDTTIYQKARDWMAMDRLVQYSGLCSGHGDWGVGDAIWSGLGSSLLIKKKPELFRETRDRITWWYSLGRRWDGGFMIATQDKYKMGPGAGLALFYTAHRKTLRITGAPPSKYAVPFTLPARLWGREADLKFMDLGPCADYAKYDKETPPHILKVKLGKDTRLASGAASLPLDFLRRNVRHQWFSIRSQAGRAMALQKRYDELERSLRDPDPRLRRAALDGIIDYNFYWGIGRRSKPLPAAEYTPGMISAIVDILKNPDEAWWVVDGALFAARNLPIATLEQNLQHILPWLTVDACYLKESAFYACLGLDRKPEALVKIMPSMGDALCTTVEYQFRSRMISRLRSIHKHKDCGEELKRAIDAAYIRMTAQGTVTSNNHHEGFPGLLSVKEATLYLLENNPELALDVARAIAPRFNKIQPRWQNHLLGTPERVERGKPMGILNARHNLSKARQAELDKLLIEKFLPGIEESCREYAEKYKKDQRGNWWSYGYLRGMMKSLELLKKLVTNPPPARTVQLPKVLILGDGDTKAYARMVADTFEGRAKVTYAGVDKLDSAMALTRLDEYLGKTKWDVILFSVGLRDLWKEGGKQDGKATCTPAHYAGNMEKLVARLKATGARLIRADIVRPLPQSKRGLFVSEKAYNAAAAPIMKKGGIATCDMNLVSRLLSLGREVHVGSKIYGKWFAPYSYRQFATEASCYIADALYVNKSEQPEVKQTKR